MKRDFRPSLGIRLIHRKDSLSFKPSKSSTLEVAPIALIRPDQFQVGESSPDLATAQP